MYPTDTPGTSSVCRFFSAAFAPKSSHFYTPLDTECRLVRDNADWTFEGKVFSFVIPASDGTCTSGSEPIYRMYNNGKGAAPNHRYTTSLAIRSEMITKGWIAEGFGATGVIGCLPIQ